MKLITDLIEDLKTKKTTKEELFNEANRLSHLYQEEYNPFVTIIDEIQHQESESSLNGIPYVLKDNFSTKDILTTASSNILKDYIPPYNATVYQKLQNAGAVLVGKTTMDELGMGGSGTTAHTGIVRNPYDKNRQIGGSSAGSAAAVALGIVPFAIGSDTGDSIRKPAGYGGVVGYKPTYGLVSRYGLIAFASSMDHVGCFTRSVEDTALVIDTIKGQDKYDMTTLKDTNESLVTNLKNDVAGKKLCYFNEFVNLAENTDNEDQEFLAIYHNFLEVIKKCRQLGMTVEGIDFGKDLLEAIIPTYMTISCAEATSNTSSLTGIQFGPRGEGKSIEELMFSARTKGFSELIKRRLIIGSFILQKENQETLFFNAQRVRRIIVDKTTEILKDYDGIILPVSDNIAPRFDETSDRLSEKKLLFSQHLAIANFGGFPSITIPSGKVDNMPIGINLMGNVKEDSQVLNIAYKLEETLGYKGLVAGGEK